MRSSVQWIVIAVLFVAVGAFAYLASSSGGAGSGETPPNGPAHPGVHYTSNWQESFAAATKQAGAEHRLILARFTGSDWCIYCKKFHAEIEDTPEFQQWAAQSVVLMDVDFPEQKAQSAELKAQNEALSEKYQVEGFPTLLLLKPDGTEVARLGYAQGGAKAWLPQAQALVEAWAPRLNPTEGNALAHPATATPTVQPPPASCPGLNAQKTGSFCPGLPATPAVNPCPDCPDSATSPACPQCPQCPSNPQVGHAALAHSNAKP